MNLLRTSLAVICVLVTTLSVILMVDRALGPARLADLTEDHIYSLSPGTESIIGQLQGDITLKLYYSRDAARKGPAQLRRFSSHFLYASDLLGEFERLSGGRLTVQIIDPAASSEDEQDARDFGLQVFPINEDEVFVFGIAAVSDRGKEASIKFLDPSRQSFLEYDVAKLLVDLMQRDRTKIGVIAGLPVMGPDMSPYMMQMMQLQGRRLPQPWIISQYLQQTYDVETVTPEMGKLPDDLDYLLVVHPKDLDAGALYAIDQYVMGGGKLIVFTDPYAIFDQPEQPPNPMMMQPPHDQSSHLNALLDKWGVHQLPGAIAADRKLAVTGVFRERPEKLHAYLELTDKQTNPDAVPVAQLKAMRLLFAGVLEKSTSDDAGDVHWLLQTTEVGNDWTPADPSVLQMLDIDKINAESKDGSKPVWLGAIITGRLHTNYPDGVTYTPAPPEPEMPGQPPPEEVPEPVTLPAGVASTDEAMVAVIADSDMLADMIAFRQAFGVDQIGDNAALLLNLLEYMGGNSDLISIRSRGEYNRPFTAIHELKEKELQTVAAEEEKLEEQRQKAVDELEEMATTVKDQKGVELFTGEFLKKRQELQDEEERIDREIRRLKRERLNRIAAVQTRIQVLTTWPVPIGLVCVLILLWIVRTIRARHFAARRET